MARKPTPFRFRDDRTRLSDFRTDFLVVCPRCERCATVTSLPQEERVIGLRARLLCPFCAYHRDRNFRRTLSGPVDSFFGRPLWLRADTGGEDLWAYNRRHLTWLMRYVQATLREKRPDPTWGWSNQSLGSRLPRSLKSAKNREQVLRGLQSLARKAP